MVQQNYCCTSGLATGCMCSNTRASKESEDRRCKTWIGALRAWRQQQNAGTAWVVLTDVVSEKEKVVVWPPPLEDVEQVEVLPVHVADHHHLGV